MLLPRDGQWHPASPIYTACEAEGISERTIRRAKDQLGIEHRRTATFPTTSTEWRWSDGAAQAGTRIDAGRTSRTSRTARRAEIPS